MTSTRVLATSCAIALATLTAASADAQMGGLLKKAKDKAQQKTEQSTANRGAPSDAFGPALTSETLTATLRGLTAEQQQLATADGLRDQITALQTRRSTLLQQNEAARQRWQLGSEKTRDCQSHVFDAASDAHSEAAKAKSQAMLADPAQMQAFMKTTQEMNAALRPMIVSHDTTGAKRLMAEYQKKLYGIDLHADTVAAVKKCGPVPAEPAALVQADSMGGQAAALDKQTRAAEQAADTKALEASGMTAAQFGLARERIVNWYAEVHNGHPYQQFGDTERKLLEAHRGEIEKVKRAL